MKYDYKLLYQKNADFYNAHPRCQQALRFLNKALTAICVLAYAALWAYALFIKPFAREDLLKIFFFPMLCLVVVTALRLFFERPRPYAENGAGITPFMQKKNSDNKSFPSRHVACAFVIAMVYMPYVLWAGAGLLVCSLALAYIRFALGLHYPSDLLAGSIVGAGVGALMFLL